MLKNKFKREKISFFLLILIAYAIISFFFKIPPFQAENKEENALNFISTAYHNIKLKYYVAPITTKYGGTKYGGIDEISGNILYVNGEGDFYSLDLNENNYLFKAVPTEPLNINKDKFIEENKDEIGDRGMYNFGVKDILIEEFNNFNNKVLLLSSLNYLEKKNCYTLSIFLSEILDESNLKISGWKNIFSTKDCLTINLSPKYKFAAAGAGGRLFKFDDNNILLSVGEFYGDGYNGAILSQDKTNDYGKILKININDFSYKIFSFGHRNPQGLYIDKKKNIFSSEHGPEAGDEINLIYEDKNYGWPLSTFGTAYNFKKWPVGITNNTHKGFEKPLFSWGNMMAVSNLIVYEKNLFDKWKGNLLVSSLQSKKLVRMVFDEKRKSIIYFENIPIGKRIRDIIQLSNGKVVLLTDNFRKPEIILLDISQ